MESIVFSQFDEIPSGGFSCVATSTKKNNIPDVLRFELSPKPWSLSDDAIALALSTLCGQSYAKIQMDLNVSETCATLIRTFTKADVTFLQVKNSEGRSFNKNGSVILNFSGGFDSMAALAVMPRDTNLVSIDWGGNFFREAEFFKRFNTNILKTNIQQLGYLRESWTFMGIGMLLFAESLGAAYGVFGGIFEASWQQFKKNPLAGRSDATVPFSGLGIKDTRITNGLTEVATAMLIAKYYPTMMVDSLNSVAGPGSEKLYRKYLLASIVNSKYGYGVSLSEPLAPKTPPFVFGKNLALDFLALYQMKNLGGGYVEKTLADVPPEVEVFVKKQRLDFYEKLNTNFLDVMPYYYDDYYLSRLWGAGIKPYKESDFDDLSVVCDFLGKWHPNIKSRA